MKVLMVGGPLNGHILDVETKELIRISVDNQLFQYAPTQFIDEASNGVYDLYHLQTETTNINDLCKLIKKSKFKPSSTFADFVVN